MATWAEMSDRQRDVALAEKAFRTERLYPAFYHGGRIEVLCFYRPDSPLITYTYDQNACNAMMYRNGKDESEGVAEPLPSFITDLTAAMGLVEEMVTRDFAWIGQGITGHYVWSFASVSVDSHVVTAATLPAAIAHAVYLALGGE